MSGDRKVKACNCPYSFRGRCMWTGEGCHRQIMARLEAIEELSKAQKSSA